MGGIGSRLKSLFIIKLRKAERMKKRTKNLYNLRRSLKMYQKKSFHTFRERRNCHDYDKDPLFAFLLLRNSPFLCHKQPRVLENLASKRNSKGNNIEQDKVVNRSREPFFSRRQSTNCNSTVKTPWIIYKQPSASERIFFDFAFFISACWLFSERRSHLGEAITQYAARSDRKPWRGTRKTAALLPPQSSLSNVPVFNVMFYPFSLLFYCWCSLRVFALKKKASRTKTKKNFDVTTFLGKNTFEYRYRLNFSEIRRSADQILFEKVFGGYWQSERNLRQCGCFRRKGSTCNSPIVPSERWWMSCVLCFVCIHHWVKHEKGKHTKLLSSFKALEVGKWS